MEARSTHGAQHIQAGYSDSPPVDLSPYAGIKRTTPTSGGGGVIGVTSAASLLLLRLEQKNVPEKKCGWREKISVGGNGWIVSVCRGTGSKKAGQARKDGTY